MKKLDEYYIYKLTVNGYYYFGITTDLERRRKAHFRNICALVKMMLKQPISQRIGDDGYAMVAKNFVKGKRTLNNENCFKETMCKIKVVAVKNTPQEAAKFETDLIKKHQDNPRCFNTDKYSKYYDRSTTRKWMADHV